MDQGRGGSERDKEGSSRSMDRGSFNGGVASAASSRSIDRESFNGGGRKIDNSDRRRSRSQGVSRVTSERNPATRSKSALIAGNQNGDVRANRVSFDRTLPDCRRVEDGLGGRGNRSISNDSTISYEQSLSNDSSEVQNTDVSPNGGGVRVGQNVEVKDEFKSKITNTLKVSWRLAQVISISSNIIRVHYDGWDSLSDENIDISHNRIREYNTPKPQTKKPSMVTTNSFYLQTVIESSERPSPVESDHNSRRDSIDHPSRKVSPQKVPPNLEMIKEALIRAQSNGHSWREDLEHLDGSNGSNGSDGFNGSKNLENCLTTEESKGLSVEERLKIAMESAHREANNLRTNVRSS
eukprot:CAMPEP_0119051736 /NCGR_PEP_ID=MMETSP1177-20130426/73255_1 /TAXON_ID=2985 /ORGANISM="Ochromonas sp, Strain CCMP1899" /LENGTH=351 /DNA_ID=CAMNT_0007031053 /DNA_START=748 /DNA_END=1803 /DNA_ORIENTATION=-